MSELLAAAKAVIDYWNRSWPLGDKLIQLRAAVERAEKPPAGFDEQLGYLKQSIRNITNAIDNETPDLALWEIRRVVATMEEWGKADAC